ncbi:MAG: prenyltransferase [Anaerolineales bacterium]|nr:prenyltransferase [Anaerolineales bacterium]
MSINFAMWRKASWQLIKMDDKKEWDALDVVSKWLIATRSAVTMVTVYSCVIAGILAARHGTFDWLTFLVVTFGLFIAHGTNNLLNDYTDFTRGVDRNNYFRTEYGVHPLVQKFWDGKTSLRWFVVSGALASLAGLYALIHTRFSPTTIGLFIFGAIILLAYTYPLKYWGLGELMIFIIWGPVLIGGVYFVLTQVWDWNVFVAGVPFGLSVVSINLAKHIDKHDPDKAKGVGTFPVRVGEANARRVTQISIVLIYVVTLYLVLDGFFTPVMLLIFLAYKEALATIRVLNQPKPAQAPAGWPAWPVWFSGFAFQHNRKFGGLLILALILDALIHHFAPTFWTGLF